MAQRYRLKLSSLKFISAVDTPAQETAVAVLTKRKGDHSHADIKARVTKLSDELGLVFGWALTSKNAGEDYFDLHGDNIVEDDLIKVAAEFMEGGGLTDEMHDDKPDGRVVFAMPMTAEVAKAFGVQTNTTGLMVAIRPSADVFEKFKSGELTGFSIAGTGEREAIKARVAKSTLYTDEIDGHQHTVCFGEDGSVWTSWATSAGAENGHSHSVTYEGGHLVILADSGHSHVLAEGQPELVIVPSTAVVVVAASARPKRDTQPTEPKSTPSIAIGKLSSQPEGTMPTEQDKLITDLTKRLERADRIAKLSGAHKSHFDSIASDDADVFVAKTSAERDAMIAAVLTRNEETNKVVYTSKSSGETYRAKDDPRLVEMAKRVDEQSEAIEKADIRSFAKANLGELSGKDEVHDYIVKSIRKGGGTKEEVDAAILVLKAANNAMATKRTPAGVGGIGLPVDKTAQDAFDAAVAKHMTDGKVGKGVATAALLNTPEGAQLYDAVAKSIRSVK